ncbi:MAG TPA: DUF3999 family protein [Vicinamibacteria bacterium]|nr:DUF3999 family protein [Vicinamibacteria bacterium]
MRRIVLAVAVAASSAAAADLDQSRTAWRYRRTVSVAPTDGFVALDLPPELRARSRPDLRDLRLLAEDGTEVPYVADRVVEREASRSWPGTLTDTAQEPVGPADEAAGTTRWTVDLGAPHEVDTIELDVREQDFAKRVRVEGSADGRDWATLALDAPVFDRAWRGRVRHTRIALDAGAAVRYLRLGTRDHRRSPPITRVGLSAAGTRRAPGEAWSRPARVALDRRDGGVTRYRVSAGVPAEELTIEADDPAFSRRIVARDASGDGSRVLADAWVYRVRLPEEALAGESLRVPLSAVADGAAGLVLEVHDGDSPPLRGLRVTVSGAATRVLFAASSAPVVVYYGNEVTRGALYDLAALHGRLATTGRLGSATLGPEQENPAYQKPPPLPVGVLRGATLEASRWRAERPLPIAAGTDLYAVTLAPEDLARLRPDLGDARIVDEQGRQVPYILEPSAREERVTLGAEKARTSGRLSRHRLRVPGLPGRSAVPLEGLVLQFDETFFDRPAGVRAGDDDRRPRRLWSGLLERRPGTDAPSPPEAIRLSWPPERVREVELEIENGDNAPLALSSAEGVVRVPRLTFQAGPGSYRLLLGNADAAAPRYDLASLRREVLAFSAVAAPLGPSRANPAFRGVAGDLLKDTPPTLLLWGTLLATVGALLWLTMRVLRQPPGSAGE